MLRTPRGDGPGSGVGRLLSRLVPLAAIFIAIPWEDAGSYALNGSRMSTYSINSFATGRTRIFGGARRCHADKVYGSVTKREKSNGVWYDLDVEACDWVNGYTVDIHPRGWFRAAGGIVVTDPPPPPTDLALNRSPAGTLGDPSVPGITSEPGEGDPSDPAVRGDPEPNGCSGGLEPGVQLRAIEPEQEEVGPAVFRTPHLELIGPIAPSGETRYAIDVGDDITRVTNAPGSVDLIWIRSLVGPDTVTVTPLSPGVSWCVLDDGLGLPGSVWIEPAVAADQELQVAWSQAAVVPFEIQNLGPLPAEYQVRVSDSYGWITSPEEVMVPVPPFGTWVHEVSLAVPGASEYWENAVRIEVNDVLDPMQSTWAQTPVHAGRAGAIGTVSYGGPEDGAIFVGAYADWNHPWVDPDYPVLIGDPGEFEMTSLDPGTYYLAAILDADGNLTPSTGDPCGVFDPDEDGEPDPVELTGDGFVRAGGRKTNGRSGPGFDFDLDQLYVSPHWTDHEARNCLLTVTDQGVVGFMDGLQTEGSGFRFPLEGPNHLYIGGLWVGLGSDYVANRDYDADPNREWTVRTDPDGALRFENDRSDLDVHALFSDSAAVSPAGLRVEQVSLAYEDPEPAGGLVIVEYYIEWQGAEPVDDLYVGLFLDFDLGVDPEDDEGAVEPSLDLAYMHETDGSPLVGVRLLRRDENPVPTANLTLVHNPTYIWPDTYVPDPDKYAFLSAADPDHVVPASTGPDDWSLLVSAGPFSLLPGEIQEVAFAVLGAEDPAGLEESAIVAELIHARNVSDANDPDPQVVERLRILPGTPNPFSAETTLRFELPERAEVEVAIFDAGGRLVRHLLQDARTSGEHRVQWDGCDDAGRPLAHGLYFARVRAAGERAHCPLTLVR